MNEVQPQDRLEEKTKTKGKCGRSTKRDEPRAGRRARSLQWEIGEARKLVTSWHLVANVATILWRSPPPRVRTATEHMHTSKAKAMIFLTRWAVSHSTMGHQRKNRLGACNRAYAFFQGQSTVAAPAKIDPCRARVKGPDLILLQKCRNCQKMVGEKCRLCSPKMSKIDFPGLRTLRLATWTTYFPFPQMLLLSLFARVRIIIIYVYY